MRAPSARSMLAPLLMAWIAGCRDGTGSNTELVLSGPADLTAVVFQSTHESGYAPGGYISQYAVWIGRPGATSPDAGVVVGTETPVFLSTAGELTRVTGADIAEGDMLQVWRDPSVAYGAVQAPPGRPCYLGLQVVIER